MRELETTAWALAIMSLFLIFSGEALACTDGEKVSKEAVLSSAPESARESYYQGVKHFDEKNYEKAVQVLSKAIELGFCSNKAFLLRSLSYMNLSKHNAAMDDVNKAIRLQPDDPKGYWIRAGIYDLQEQHRKAVDDLSHGLKLNPTSDLKRMMYARRGENYLELDEGGNAIQDLTKSIQMGEKSVDVFLNRGRAFIRLKRYHKAISDFTEILKNDPDHYQGRLGRGWVYSCLGDFEQGVKDFSYLIEKHPSDMSARNYRGWAFAHLKKDSAAIADLTLAAKREPKSPWLYLLLADLYYQDEQFEKAIKANLTAAKYANKESTGAIQLQKGLLFLVTGHFEAANRSYEKGRLAAIETYDRITLEEAIRVLKYAMKIDPKVRDRGAKIAKLLEESLSKIPLDSLPQNRWCPAS